MNAYNPYAPSPASLKATGKSDVDQKNGVWRDGKVLVLLPGASLPDRCVKCNEHAAVPTKSRTIYWHHPGIYALLLLNVIIYIVTAMIVRKKAVIAPGLCPDHKKRRTRAILLGWLGTFVGLGLLLHGGTSHSPGYMVLGIFAILFCSIAGMIMARIVYAKRIDKSFIRLKGCGKEFLDSFPAFHG